MATVITQWNRGGNRESGFYAAANQSSGATKFYAPGLRHVNPPTFDKYSAVVVQNLGSATADVTIVFYDRAGNDLLTFNNEMIAAGASLGLNTRNGGDKDGSAFNALGDAYEGHAVVTSNNGQPLSVVVNGISKAPNGGSATTNGVTE